MPPSIIDDCEVRRTIISEGCHIKGAKLHHSVIGIRSQIGYNVLVEDSVLMGADVYQSMKEIRADVRKDIPPVGLARRQSLGARSSIKTLESEPRFDSLMSAE